MPLAHFYDQLPLQEKLDLVGAFTRPGFVNMVAQEINRLEIGLTLLDASNEEEFIQQYKSQQFELQFWREVMQVTTRAAQEIRKHA